MKKIIWILGFCFICSNLGIAQNVYPGDVDNNGEVNHLDLLYIGLANGAVGPPRTTFGTNWQPYPANAWGITLPNTGLDYAYADCDGNGFIDFNDILAIDFNYGQTHGVPTPNTFLEGVPNLNSELFFDSIGFVNIFFQTGFAVININLGTPALPAVDFYGLSFTIEYDPNIFCDISCMTGFNPDLDPIFGPNSFSFYEVSNYKNNDPTSGELEVTIVRNNQMPVDGFGRIGTYAGIIEDNVVDLYGSGVDLDTKIKIKNIKFIDEAFIETPTVGDSVYVHIIDPDSLISSTEDLELGINVFPNPVEDILTIESLQNSILQTQIMNLNGKTVYFKENKLDAFNSKKVELSLIDYPEGIYFVKLLTEKGNLVKKITVLRE